MKDGGTERNFSLTLDIYSKAAMAYVYTHTRLDTGEVFYVGIGSDSNHERAYSLRGRNTLWYKVIKETDYKVDIVYDNLKNEESFVREKELIKKYGRYVDKAGTLVNLTEGGEGFRSAHTQETKDKIRRATKGRTYEERYGKEKAAKLKKIRQEKQKKIWSSRNLKAKQEIADKISNTQSTLPKEKIKELVNLWKTKKYSQKNLAALYKLTPAQIGSLVHYHKNKFK